MRGRGRFKDENQWPEPDRTRWRRGLSPASLLDDTGHAAKWRPATRSKVGRGYATYINWLEISGQLHDGDLPEQRFTPDRLAAYCTYQSETVKPTTIHSRLIDLVRALSVIAPKADVTFIRRRARLYPKTGDRLAKRARMQEPEKLLRLGLDLMAEVESKPAKTRRDAVRYRDGLIIALLACRAMRLRNLTSVEIGRHLNENDDHWELIFDGTETKNHRVWANGWPERLVPQLGRYLALYRLMLMDGRYHGDHLWISDRPGPLTYNGIYYAIITRTEDAFGESVNPHLFRDAAATSLAVHASSRVRLARHVLGHADYRTTEEAYNQALSIEASFSLNAAMLTLRRRLRRCS